MKLCYIALALSAPSAFGYGDNCALTEGSPPYAAPVLTGADESYPGKVLENPGTFYYYSDYTFSELGFRICPLNDTSGSFTISAGDCVLTDEGCVTSIGWPGTPSEGDSLQDMQSCVFSGVTAAKVMNFSTEEDYDYVAYGNCVPETPIALFQYQASSLSDCGTNGEYAYTSNPGNPDSVAPQDGLFKCLDFSMGDEATELLYGDDGNRTYSRSFYGCQEAFYSAPNCQEADLVDITAENYANFNHTDELFQTRMREFGSELQNFTHPRVPNVKSYDPSGACQEFDGSFLSTICECLEGYCLYYECAQGSYGGQELSCSECAAIDNCDSVSCSTGSDQICVQCAAGYAGEGTNICTEIPSGQTAVFLVSSVYTFNSAFTAADIPNAKQDVATAADVETSKVEMEIRAGERRKRAEEVVVDVAIQFDDFATAEAKAIALEATPVAFTNLKAGNSEVQDPDVGPYAASTVLVQDNTSSAPVFVGSLVMAILALF